MEVVVVIKGTRGKGQGTRRRKGTRGKGREEEKGQGERDEGKGTRDEKKKRDKGRGTRDEKKKRDKGRGTRDEKKKRDKGRGTRDEKKKRDKGRGERDEKKKRDKGREEEKGQGERDEKKERDKGREKKRKMSGNGNYKNLIVWQKSITLVKKIYKVSGSFPSEEKFGLISQMRRAVVSIPSNIAEGQAKMTTKDYIRFVSIAEGSLAELETQLIIAVELDFCSKSAVEDCFSLMLEIRKMLNALRISLTRKLK